MELRTTPLAGYALYVELCSEISLECNRRVHALYYTLLDRAPELGITEVVPAYTSLTVFYDPRRVGWRAVCPNSWPSDISLPCGMRPSIRWSSVAPTTHC